MDNKNLTPTLALRSIFCYIAIILSSCNTDEQTQLNVGGQYTICSPKNKNPFDERTIAPVTIVAKKDGYVQYCWTHDLNVKDKTLFSRSEEEFIYLMKNCNP